MIYFSFKFGQDLTKYKSTQDNSIVSITKSSWLSEPGQAQSQLVWYLLKYVSFYNQSSVYIEKVLLSHFFVLLKVSSGMSALGRQLKITN